MKLSNQHVYPSQAATVTSKIGLDLHAALWKLTWPKMTSHLFSKALPVKTMIRESIKGKSQWTSS